MRIEKLKDNKNITLQGSVIWDSFEGRYILSDEDYDLEIEDDDYILFIDDIAVLLPYEYKEEFEQLCKKEEDLY